MTQIISGTIYSTTSSFISSNTFNFSVILNYSPSILNNITIGVLIMNYTLINTLTADFHGYSLKGYIHTIVSTSPVTAKSCSNTSCGLYYIVGVTKQTFSIGYQLALNIDRT